MAEYMLTTVDNPFSPFTQWRDWFLYDTSHGYNTCGYLARISVVSPDLSEEEYDRCVEDAMDEIIEYDPLGIYIKVTRDFYPTTPTYPVDKVIAADASDESSQNNIKT